MGLRWHPAEAGDPCAKLQSSPQLGKQKVQHIIDKWLGSEHEAIPVCAATMSRMLKSEAVRLLTRSNRYQQLH